jgi:hypothetical protein
MINVKKLASGKLSFKLDFDDSQNVSVYLMSFIENESHKIRAVKIHEDTNRWLMYYVISEFFKKHNGKLFGTQPEYNYVITRSEALGLIWLFRDLKSSKHFISSLFELKTALHQKLS